MSGEQLLYNRPTFPAQLDMSHPLTKGLVGCWVLNEEGGLRAFDSSPYKNHGLVTGAKGNYQGRTFDGIDDVISLGQTNLVSTQFSILSWVNTTTLTGNGTIIGKDGAGTRGWYLLRNGSVIFFENTLTPGNISGSTSWQTNTWYHAAFTWDGKFYRVYLNGNIDAAPVAAAALADGSDILGIGNAPPFAGYWSGKIGEVLIHRRALTAVEIQQNYLNPWDMFLR